jgi:chromosomal replication initiation ATPase DnaA
MKIEPDFQAELKAHYSAVHARLWTPRATISPRLLCRPLPPQEPPREPAPQQIAAQPMPPATAEEIAAKWRRDDERFGGHVSPKAIIDVAAAYFNVRMGDLFSKSRVANVITARQTAMYVMRVLCRIPFMKIGRLLDRDHSSAVHAINHRIPKRMGMDKKFATDIEYIIELLKR